MKRNLLLSPGPTQVPPDVCEALAWPLIHHRTPQFQDNLKSAIEGLKYVFQTKDDIFFVASSGTGGMEAAIANLVSPGDHVLTVDGGKFGERWGEMVLAYNAKPQVLQVEWGKAINPDVIRIALDEDKSIKAVFVTLNETSTGVISDIETIARIVSKTSAVFVVDAISGLGVVDLKTDQWNVDVVVGASHKGFMLPPGVAFLSVSDKAYKVIEESTSPRFYFDLRKAKKVIDKPDTPFTPAIGITRALNVSLDRFKNEGLENVFSRFEKLAKGTRAAVKAIGLNLFPDESCASYAQTTIILPAGIDGNQLVKLMRDTYSVTVAGGQAHMKGKMIRMGHMGCINEYDILTGISCFEKVLNKLGYQFNLGDGIAAAQKVFNE